MELYAQYCMCLFPPPSQGGTHVNYVVDQVVSKLLEVAKKKNKGGMDLKPFHIKGHLWVFVNCLIENPTFDSQTKENMTLKVKSFGSTCLLNEKFIKQVGRRDWDSGSNWHHTPIHYDGRDWICEREP